jgi:hypothetical protein
LDVALRVSPQSAARIAVELNIISSSDEDVNTVDISLHKQGAFERVMFMRRGARAARRSKRLFRMEMLHTLSHRRLGLTNSPRCSSTSRIDGARLLRGARAAEPTTRTSMRRAGTVPGHERSLGTGRITSYDVAMTFPLHARIAQRQPGICLYGLAPPKLTTAPEQLASIAAQQVERLGALDIDGVIVYDIRDEAERTSELRPFPFLPTLAPQLYADVHLSALGHPKVVYRCVSSDTRESFLAWLGSVDSARDISVLVGAPSRHATVGLSLREAYALVAEHAPSLTLGGIAIAERHERTHDEHERILAKSAAGCRFFVTQAVYDVSSTLSLLSDYALALGSTQSPPLPIVLTFSPCGSLKTLAFMKWLGIHFPRWLENELRFASDPLETSLRLCERIFLEVWSYAREKGIPLGINVESVSIRKLEIDASVHLVQTLRGHMSRSLGAARG